MYARLLAVLTLSLLLAYSARPAVAQQVDSVRTEQTAGGDAPPSDSLEALQEGRPPGGASSSQPTDAPEGAVQFSARDSLVITFDGENGDVGTLFGDAEINHGEVILDAYTIDLLMDQEELRARGLETDTGMVGRPQFQRGGGSGGQSPGGQNQGESGGLGGLSGGQSADAFTGTELAYNLRTERGRVVGARTQMEEGFVEGRVVKMTTDSTFYVSGGTYTTCDCAPGETPSYSLRSRRMKIDGEWVYTGPIQLYIFNVPMPLWLPFGVLPAIEGRRSGPLPPSYGEDDRGFYLKDWGWYWAMNDYMDFQLQFGLWSRGSWEVRPRYRYNRRYHYDGQLQFDYVRSQRGEPIDPDYAQQTSASFRWRHQQTISPTSNLSGNINLSTASYLRNVSESFNDNVRQEISSNVNYNKSWDSRRLTLNMRHQQVLTTGATTLTLPNLSFKQSSFKPFEHSQRRSGEDARWYERITTSYTGSLQNRYNFDPLSAQDRRARGDTTASGDLIDPDISWYEALVDPGKYRRATGDATPFDFSTEHRIPVSAPFSINRLPLVGPLQFNLSPSLNYNEEWFIQTVRQEPIEAIREDGTETIVSERTVPGFFSRREFTSSLSANTTFYGTFPVRAGAFEGLRHTVRPSLSLSYQPNYNSDFWGYTRTAQLDDDPELERYDITTGRIVSGSTAQRSLNFSIDNVFETKRVRVDSTGERQSETLRLLDVDISSGYNFAADSLQFSDINLRARTNVFDQFNLQLSSTFSPYVRRDGRTIDRFVLAERGLPARLTNLRFTARTSIDGGSSQRSQQAGRGAVNEREAAPPPPGTLAPPTMRERGTFASTLTEADRYIDFSIPWSVNLNLYYQINNRDRFEQSARLDADFDLSLTPKWKVTGNTGFDFQDMEVTYTKLNIVRDFECWRMSFNWTPFGQRQQYGFSLYVKSGKLADLLRLNLPRSGIRDRFEGAARNLTQ